MATGYHQSFDHPDEVRPFKGHGHLDVLNFDGKAIGRGVFSPGWRWSQDVKPIANTESCQAEHNGVCLNGRMTIRMDNGEEFEIQAGEAFHIPPGHDAWNNGDTDCVLIDTGAGNYAKS